VAYYIEQARQKRISSMIAGHTSILWITGRVIGAIAVSSTDLAWWVSCSALVGNPLSAVTAGFPPQPH
jgi:hypothetical protein